MIKVNVITKNIDWYNYIKNPSSYIDRRINRLNTSSENFKNKS